jgi:hypothetical protein
LGKEYFDQYGDKFKSGGLKKGIPIETLDKVWSDLCAYGAWSFNKSHAVAYGIISYWCAYMKAHYPFEYAAAMLSHEGDSKKQIQILREMHAEGISYIPVDKELSDSRWRPAVRSGQKYLIGPLSMVKGIGPKLMSDILRSRSDPVGRPMSPRAIKLLDNPKTEIDDLWPISARIKQLMPDPAARNIHTPPTRLLDVQIDGEEHNVLVFCTVKQIKPRDENEAVNVARRGGRRIIGSQTASLNLFLNDDTDEIFAKVERQQFKELGQPIVDRGRAGKALYAIKGSVPRNFRMIRVENVRYIGDMDE